VHFKIWGRRDPDRMVDGFTTTYAISAYHHWCCEFESRSEGGVQHYVIKFVSDLRQVGGFLRVLQTNKQTLIWLFERLIGHCPNTGMTFSNIAVKNKNIIFFTRNVLFQSERKADDLNG